MKCFRCSANLAPDVETDGFREIRTWACPLCGERSGITLEGDNDGLPERISVRLVVTDMSDIVGFMKLIDISSKAGGCVEKDLIDTLCCFAEGNVKWVI